MSIQRNVPKSEYRTLNKVLRGAGKLHRLLAKGILVEKSVFSWSSAKFSWLMSLLVELLIAVSHST